MKTRIVDTPLALLSILCRLAELSGEPSMDKTMAEFVKMDLEPNPYIKAIQSTINHKKVFTSKNSEADLDDNENAVQCKQQLKELKKQYGVHTDRRANGTVGADEDMTNPQMEKKNKNTVVIPMKRKSLTVCGHTCEVEVINTHCEQRESAKLDTMEKLSYDPDFTLQEPQLHYNTKQTGWFPTENSKPNSGMENMDQSFAKYKEKMFWHQDGEFSSAAKEKYRIAVSFPLWADLTLDLVLRKEKIMGAEHKECFWKVGSSLDRREQPKQTSSRNHSDLRARARPSVTPTLISLVLFSDFLQPPPDVFRISAIQDQPGARVTGPFPALNLEIQGFAFLWHVYYCLVCLDDRGLFQDPAPLRTWQRTQRDTELIATQSFFKAEAANNWIGSRGNSKLQHGFQASAPGGADADISRVLNGNKSASCKQQLLPGPLQMQMPALFLLQMHCFPCKSRLVPPQGVPAARNLRTASSFICRTSRPLDIVQTAWFFYCLSLQRLGHVFDPDRALSYTNKITNAIGVSTEVGSLAPSWVLVFTGLYKARGLQQRPKQKRGALQSSRLSSATLLEMSPITVFTYVGT
ncbi:hypothetical protein U0070_023863 [Myodes glareolus]|uniref:Uncharacterized protein n=1 Tax=Myodes glareolus TaxID=447135 RepID=A0AAW0HW90_MYOGA